MLVRILKSKLHAATVTEANIEYMGSITISKDILEASGMLPYEEVHCSNFRNGERWTTYIIATERAGVIGLNGPAAHLGKGGDRIVVMAYGLMTEEDSKFHQPRILVFDERNQVMKRSKE
jgi:aspartate 1-decarboxylase